MEAQQEHHSIQHAELERKLLAGSAENVELSNRLRYFEDLCNKQDTLLHRSSQIPAQPPRPKEVPPQLYKLGLNWGTYVQYFTELAGAEWLVQRPSCLPIEISTGLRSIWVGGSGDSGHAYVYFEYHELVALLDRVFGKANTCTYCLLPGLMYDTDMTMRTIVAFCLALCKLFHEAYPSASKEYADEKIADRFIMGLRDIKLSEVPTREEL